MEKFRILFASTPPEPKDIKAKGINLLLRLAEKAPEVEIVIAMRPWKSKPVIERMVRESGLRNIMIETDISDMNDLIGSVHATIAPFLVSTKSAPLSIIESLMAGKPVIVSLHAEVLDLLKSEKCAIVFDPNDESSLVKAVMELRDNYAFFQENSRPCAEKYYSLDRFIKDYEALYQEVLAGRKRPL